METSTYSDLPRASLDGTNSSPANRVDAAGSDRETTSTSRRTFVCAAGATGSGLLGGGPLRGVLTSGTRSTCDEGAVISSPLRGEWMVSNPPGHPALADDFVGMRAGHLLPYPASSVPRHLLSKMPVDRAYGWGRPVYAPVEGTVVGVSNRERDRVRVNLAVDALRTFVSPPAIEDGDVRPAAGNYVLIESVEGISFLAHLRRGSVVVSEGTDVAPGRLIGRVGNSGASLFPHLHYQLMSEWTIEPSRIEDVLLPYRFSGYERRAGNWSARRTWEPVRRCVPGQWERFRTLPESNDGRRKEESPQY